MSIGSVVSCVMLLAGSLFCSRRAPPPVEATVPNVHLDSGNIRFAAGDHAAALAHYHAAIATNGADAAAWYGVYMTSRVMGDSAAAEDALGQVRRLAPGAPLVEHPHGTRGNQVHPGPSAPGVRTP